MRYSLFFLATLLNAQTAGYQALTDAYSALKAGQYEAAVAGFEKALTLEPGRASIHKDAAYACLKIGENHTARLHFQKAMELDPADFHASLEYAFLVSKRRKIRLPRKPRRGASLTGCGIKSWIAKPPQRQNGPSRISIGHWRKVLHGGPQPLKAAAPSFSVHHELAELAEQRDLWDLAAAHYLAAWRLEPQRKTVLID